MCRFSCSAAAAICSILLAVAGCARDQAPPPAPAVAGGERSFSGTITASGSTVVLPMAGGEAAVVARLSGNALLAGEQRPALGYHVEILSHSSPGQGMHGSAVWTDHHGDRVFSELRAEARGPDRPVSGTIVGGTGRYAGASGDYRFTWQYMMPGDDGGVGARVTDLQGRIRFAPAAEAKP